jgi:hypothetical protein
MKKDINICFFLSIIFILIKIKIDIDINNEKWLETIWKHERKKKKKNLIIH